MESSSEEKRIRIAEAADYLKVSESTIHRWIRQGVIPVYKVENQFEFKFSELEAWASYKNMGTGTLSQNTPVLSDEESIDVMDALSRGGIHYNIKGMAPSEIYKNIMDRVFDPATIATRPDSEDQKSPLFQEMRDLLYESLVERENLASTGLGGGIAVPHPRKPQDWGLKQPLFAVVFLDEPVDYGAVDGEPVFVLFVILCSTVKGHLKLLSRVSHMIHTAEMQEFLQTIPDPHSLRKKFLEKLSEGSR